MTQHIELFIISSRQSFYNSGIHFLVYIPDIDVNHSRNMLTFIDSDSDSDESEGYERNIDLQNSITAFKEINTWALQTIIKHRNHNTTSGQLSVLYLQNQTRDLIVAVINAFHCRCLFPSLSSVIDMYDRCGVMIRKQL
jgi:hypothetical protein